MCKLENFIIIQLGQPIWIDARKVGFGSYIQGS